MFTFSVFPFQSKDAFVVGYGLDWAEKLRELEYVGILKEELYKH
jgi:hypoxanthine-guanine phosphoribosyltransferase